MQSSKDIGILFKMIAHHLVCRLVNNTLKKTKMFPHTFPTRIIFFWQCELILGFIQLFIKHCLYEDHFGLVHNPSQYKSIVTGRAEMREEVLSETF